MYYAQIDENDICRGVIETPEEINSPYAILLSELDIALLGKKRVGEAWEDVPVIPVEPQPDRITQLEQVVDTLLTGGETA